MSKLDLSGQNLSFLADQFSPNVHLADKKLAFWPKPDPQPPGSCAQGNTHTRTHTPTVIAPSNCGKTPSTNTHFKTHLVFLSWMALESFSSVNWPVLWSMMSTHSFCTGRLLPLNTVCEVPELCKQCVKQTVTVSAIVNPIIFKKS